MLTRAIAALRRACATGRDAQTVTVRREHLRELLEAYDADHRGCDRCKHRDRISRACGQCGSGS